MPVEGPPTLRGALLTLGKVNSGWLTRMNSLLDGLIAGPAGGSYTGLLNLIDVRTDGLGLTRQAVSALCGQTAGTSGMPRHELARAAHTLLVLNAFLGVLQRTAGPWVDKLRPALHKTLDDARRRGARPAFEEPVGPLLDLDIPMPWAGRGFAANLAEGVVPRCITMAQLSGALLNGVAEGERQLRGFTFATDTILVATVHAYTEDYGRLAAQVPEFGYWELLGEAAAGSLHRMVMPMPQADASARALARVEALLSRATGAPGLDAAAGSPPQRLIRDLHAKVLRRPVLPTEDAWWAGSLRLPDVRDIYVTPAYRCCVADAQARIADETWWAQQPLHEDLDLFLSGHLASAESLSRPLLILGHPGSGKSLLTSVLAARLPAAFTPVWVPLRYVDAFGSVGDQVQQRLDQLTNRRMRWTDLADDDAASTRVVLLDGLDELMLASGASQSRYLSWVASFQQIEAEYGRPVAAVVTSRTVVADRLALPPGTLVVKLEDFDDRRVGTWLDAWNRTNAGADRFAPLHLADVARAGDLARQPLLLLMLALYSADQGNAALGTQARSAAQLYDQLVGAFVHREVDKELTSPHHRDLGNLMELRRGHLAIAAFGMFNRGRQHISERELNHDVAVLEPQPQRRGAAGGGGELDEPIDAAADIIGRFFFVHAPSSEWAERGGRTQPPRMYEFLHATFGEFLIAQRTVAMLCELAAVRHRARGRRPMFPVDNSELRALLGHQPLLKGPRMLSFIQEMWADRAELDRQALAEAVHELLGDDVDRLLSEHQRLAAYNPSGTDELTRVATYFVNLVTLRVLIGGEAGGVDIADLVPPGHPDPQRWWSSMVRTWRAMLSPADWGAVLDAFDCAWALEPGAAAPGGRIVAARAIGGHDWRAGARRAYGEARLTGDIATEAWVRAGHAAWNGAAPLAEAHAAIHEHLVHAYVNDQPLSADRYAAIGDLLQDTPHVLPPPAAALLVRCLRRDIAALSTDLVGRLLPFALHPDAVATVTDDLVIVSIAQPDLLGEGLYDAILKGDPGGMARAVELLAGHEWIPGSPQEAALRRLRVEIMRRRHLPMSVRQPGQAGRDEHRT
ncbi:ATP-binding protein [Dactylosporangium sp. NPDC051485]|uniref:NACHT domain-containing protein n=1 Tax=Dactylosporangium sp. NPDC051485 TaxID=3154846 RepID=UPI003425AA3C